MATATIPTSPASPASREAVVMRSDAPTVSVCVPVYNAAAHLGECIDSILAQTYTDFELLIVDDGSTDDSRDVVRAYADPRIRLLENAHDYIGSLNLLLREARGRYVARMDADDLMLPDRLQVQVDYMEAHPEVDILGGGMTYFGDAQGTALPQPGERPLTFSLFMRGCALMHPTVMMRRASLEAHGLRYEQEYVYAEDYRLWVMALEAGLRLVNLDRPLIKYRVSPAQVSAVHKAAQDEAGRRVKEEIVRWQTRSEVPWALPSPLRLPDTSNLLTVIIPFLNEGEEVVATVRGVRDTVGARVDILVINDGSYDGFPYGEQLASYGVHYVLNRTRRGVAASRDLGVRLCRTPYFLLLDAHMRFYDRTWADRVVEVLQADDRKLLCCQTRFLYHHPETGELSAVDPCPTTYGAYCPFGHKAVWPDIAWNLREMRPGEPREDIAAVLGAGYAASRRYWARLRGLEGLRSYGSDEAYLSFKVWLEGGRCVLLKDVVIGHVYRDAAPYVILGQESVYNQLLIARLLFPQSLYCRTLVRALRQKGATAVQALHDLSARRRSLGRLRAYYRSIFTRPMADVLSLHAERRGIDTTASAAVCELLDRLPDIYDRLTRCAPVGDGLYEGRAGRALWLCRYARHAGLPACEDEAAALWAEVEAAVQACRLPWGFGYGLSGVGWCALYLWRAGLLEDYPAELLDAIDRQLALLDPTGGDDLGFDTGLAGVLPYLCLRLGVGMPTGWTPARLRRWDRLAARVKRTSCDETALYYAYLYAALRHDGSDADDLPPSPADWCMAALFLPRNPDFWSLSLAGGVAGASLRAMLMAPHTERISNKSLTVQSIS